MGSSSSVPGDTAPREQLVAEIRDRLARLGAPRLQILLIVVLAGLAAFLTSVAGLWLGAASMTVRYALAAVAGYLMFIALVRAWIAWQRGSWPDIDIGSDFLDIDLPVPRSAPPADAHLFAGGRSGGGGAAADLAGVRDGPPPARAGSKVASSLDLDELWPVLLALACALGGLLTVVYVVWTAPLLLAEVALDGAVFGAVYRRLRARDASHWAATTVRRTWMPAAILVLFAAGCGFAFEQIAPDAQSIGGVVRALLSER